MSSELRRLIVPLRYPQLDAGKREVESFVQRVYNGIFRAEMVAVYQIYAQLAGSQELIVFDIRRQVRVTAEVIRTLKTCSTRAAHDGKPPNRTPCVVIHESETGV